MIGLRRFIYGGVSSLLLGTMLVACGSGPSDNEATKPKLLTIATPGDAPPYEFQDDKGNWQGINYDVMTDVFKSAGYEIEYRAMSFAGMLPALSSGRVDLTTALYDTAERRKTVDFLDFLQTRFGVLVPAGDAASIKGWADLCGKRVGAILSNPIEAEVKKQSQDACASAGKKKIELIPHPSITQELQDLDHKRLDALIEDEGVFGHVATQNPGKYVVAFATGSPNTFGIGFKSGSPLQKKIKPFLDKYLASNKPASVAKTWGLRPEVFLKDSTPVSFD